jgi:hypothetical protein
MAPQEEVSQPPASEPMILPPSVQPVMLASQEVAHPPSLVEPSQPMSLPPPPSEQPVILAPQPVILPPPPPPPSEPLYSQPSQEVAVEQPTKVQSMTLPPKRPVAPKQPVASKQPTEVIVHPATGSSSSSPVRQLNLADAIFDPDDPDDQRFRQQFPAWSSSSQDTSTTSTTTTTTTTTQTAPPPSSLISNNHTPNSPKKIKGTMPVDALAVSRAAADSPPHSQPVNCSTTGQGTGTGTVATPLVCIFI